MQGDGIVDFFRQLIFGRDSPTNKVKKQLKQHGDKKIKSIQIVRQPISGGIQKMLNYLTLGKIKKDMVKQGYDRLFHLSAIIGIEGGPKLRIEKNETVDLSPPKKFHPESEFKSVPVTGDITLNEVYENTRKLYDDDKHFYGYDSVKNNCQLFISNFLKGNKSNFKYTNSDLDFVNQDIEFIAKKYPYTSKIAKWLTDIANKLGVLTGQGENNISNNDIENMQGEGKTIDRLGKMGSLLNKYGPKKLYRIAKELDENVKPSIKQAAKRELKKLPKKVLNELENEYKGKGFVKDLGKFAKKVAIKGKKAVKKAENESKKVGKKVIRKSKKAVEEFKEGFKGGSYKIQFGGSNDEKDAEKVDDLLEDGNKVELDISVKQIEKQPKSRLKRWAKWAKKGFLTITRKAKNVVKDVAKAGFEIAKDVALPIAKEVLSSYLRSKISGSSDSSDSSSTPQEGTTQEGGQEEETKQKKTRLPNNSLPQAVGRAGNPRFMNNTFLQLPVRRDLQLQSGGSMCDKIKTMRKIRKGRF